MEVSWRSDSEQEKKKVAFSTATYSFQVLNEVTERMLPLVDS